jgi:hypothetical protein
MDIHTMIQSFKSVTWRSPLHEYQLLYSLVAFFRPQKIFEIGTSKGLSSITMAAALRDWNINGHIWTTEIEPKFYEIAVEYIKQYGMRGWITTICGDGKIEAPKYAPYDLAFIDGAHDYVSVKADFTVLKKLSKHILFHDSQWLPTPDVKEFIDECRTLPEYDIINLKSAEYDIDSCGIAIFMHL